MSEPTAEDRETARELQTAIVHGANPIPGAKRVEAWEIIAAALTEAREEAEAPLRDKLGHVRVQRNEHQAYIVELETELREMRRRNEHWREEVGKKESRIGTLSDRLGDQQARHEVELRALQSQIAELEREKLRTAEERINRNLQGAKTIVTDEHSRAAESLLRKYAGGISINTPLAQDIAFALADREENAIAWCSLVTDERDTHIAELEQALADAPADTVNKLAAGLTPGQKSMVYWEAWSLGIKADPNLAGTDVDGNWRPTCETDQPVYDADPRRQFRDPS